MTSTDDPAPEVAIITSTDIPSGHLDDDRAIAPADQAPRCRTSRGYGILGILTTATIVVLIWVFGTDGYDGEARVLLRAPSQRLVSL
jgi:hypothetical protein